LGFGWVAEVKRCTGAPRETARASCCEVGG
jgi:hypothetical protein